jgi:hypothetical protein
MWVPSWLASDETQAGTFVAVAAPYGQESMDAGQLYARPVTEDEVSWELVSGPEDYVIDVAVSPDGHYAAYTLYVGSGNRPIPRADLMLLDLSTRQTRQLTEGADFEGLATWILVEPQ